MQLISALTKYKTSFTPQHRESLRGSILRILAARAGEFWDNTLVRPALLECYCRLQKLCWFDKVTENPEEQIIRDVRPFLEHSLAHSIMGMNLLQELVNAISKNTEGLSSPVQRRIQTVFREKTLLKIFEIALHSLKRVVTLALATNEKDRQQQLTLRHLTLQLLVEVLHFDFIGLRPDEGDDVGVIHIPNIWAPLLNNPSTLELLFATYHAVPPPFSTTAMEVLSQFASIRNSIYAKERRQDVVNQFVDGFGKILNSQKDLQHELNAHHLMRALVRLKGNYQLKHIAASPNYPLFIQKVTDFSAFLFRNATSLNSIFYCFTFWQRMVQAYHLQSGEPIKKDQYLIQLTPTILRSFIESQLSTSSLSLHPPSSLAFTRTLIGCRSSHGPELSEFSRERTPGFVFERVASDYEASVLECGPVSRGRCGAMCQAVSRTSLPLPPPVSDLSLTTACLGVELVAR